MQDGPSPPPPATSGGAGGQDGEADEKTAAVLIYHPLRDALRKELTTYADLVSPPLTGLIRTHTTNTAENGGTGPVVSHKDLSIETVMTRYFADVEASYPSVVANVARTTGKLVRTAAAAAGREGCGLCGMPLDAAGDERWRGELGIPKTAAAAASSGAGGLGGRLCYGCERSTAG